MTNVNNTAECYFCGKPFDSNRPDLMKKLQQPNSTCRFAGAIGKKVICKECVRNIECLIKGENREEWDFLKFSEGWL